MPEARRDTDILDRIEKAYLAAPDLPRVLRMRVDAFKAFAKVNKDRRGCKLGECWAGCLIRLDLENDDPQEFEFV